LKRKGQEELNVLIVATCLRA